MPCFYCRTTFEHCINNYGNADDISAHCGWMGHRWHGVSICYSSSAVSTNRWLPLARTCSVTDYCWVDKEIWCVQLLWDHETRKSFRHKGNTSTVVTAITVPSLHTRPCIHIQCTWDCDEKHIMHSPLHLWERSDEGTVMVLRRT
jgi:hypothetical protein